MGIEPTSEAWEALNKNLKAIDLAALSFPKDSLSWKPDGNRTRTPVFSKRWTVCLVTQEVARLRPVASANSLRSHRGDCNSELSGKLSCL
jgi:hypothetical protein